MRAAARLADVQIRTAIIFYERLRKLIAGKLGSYELSGEVNADESYFGGGQTGKRRGWKSARISYISPIFYLIGADLSARLR